MTNRIRELRKARRLTLEELGRMTGLAMQHLSRLEMGTRRLHEDQIHRIAAALGVPPAELLPRRGPVEQEIIESSEELKVLRWWRQLSRDEKFYIITMAKGLGRDPSINGYLPEKRSA